MSCGVNQFAKLVAKLTTYQREWVVDMGFEELLHMRVINIEPKFGFWITSKFDPETLELKIRDNYKVKLDEEMVCWVLGLKSGEHLINPTRSEMCVDYHNKRQEKKNKYYGAIKESEVYSQIIQGDPNEQKFKTQFLLYALGTILCPMRECGWISPLHANVLEYATKASHCNWAKYLLDWLVTCGQHLHTPEEGYGGCTLLLLVSDY